MRRFACFAGLATLLGVVGPSLLGAADPCWTPVESELWQRERAYHRQLQEEDLVALADFWHHQGVAWPSHAAEPLATSAGRMSLSKLLESVRIVSFDIRPLMIRVIGEVAVVHYRLDWEIEDADGSRSTACYRITHTWLKENGQWRILTGMSSAVSTG